MYCELHSRSAFSFLRGGSVPEELVDQAAAKGLPAMALCDRDGVYGAPRFYAAARRVGVRAIIGSELTMEDGSVLPVLVKDQRGYRHLCQLLTRAHLRSAKGESRVRWEELAPFAEGLVALTGDEEGPLMRAVWAHPQGRPDGAWLQSGDPGGPRQVLEKLKGIFGGNNLYVELQRHQVRGERRWGGFLVALAAQQGVPLLATNGVAYGQREGREVLDVFTCLRHHTHLDEAGLVLEPNSERHVKSGGEMEALFEDLPEAIENTVKLAERLQFSLENLGYEFPRYPVGDGETMEGTLREGTFRGAKERYGIVEGKVRQQLEHELALINKLGFAGYFLIVWDIVKFCRENHIMCQGRGSAANSAVCYSLGITAVDPVGSNLLFERFLSEGRRGWPDIDIDLPSGERRERVIQEIYRRYGRHGAAMTANVITYRGRSAAREIGKALNLSPDVLNRFSQLFASGDFPHTLDLSRQMEQAGLPAGHPRATAFARLYQRIYGLPRHLGQHSGGMIVCQGQLDSIMPLENASMAGRVVAQWDKEDCEDLGIIKVDLLGLGMMSVLQDAIELTKQRGHPVDLAKIPTDDPATYEIMQRADTIGLFQIESRAQMATLPRMKPKCFYDVVIEVALIRPGPIQGHLMHPYLARRCGKEPVTYYDERLRPVLERTLGVPLFQEQMLKIAMVMADFSGAEAEELRRALSFHRSQERMHEVEVKLRRAMKRKGVQAKVIDQIVSAIGSFALYGFPESHAISFAILAYGSAYLKVHYAPEFYASLLNNQPMGFYSPATLVKDAKRHGVKVRPVCVRRSRWECVIEADESVRLGLCVVQGLREKSARELVRQREEKAFEDLGDFRERTGLNREELQTLAEVGALNGLAEHRREALWQVSKRRDSGELFQDEDGEKEGPLARMSLPERIESDYAGMQMTLGMHPMALIRSQVPDLWRAVDLPRGKHGQRVRIGGNVICRQRPGTAKGFLFISVEDETGIANAIVAPALFEEHRLVITQEAYLVIEGKLQQVEGVIHVKAQHVEGMRVAPGHGSRSYDFR